MSEEKETQVITAADVGTIDAAMLRDPELPDTREGQEAHVKSVARRCRGPKLVSDEDVAPRWDAWRVLRDEDDWDSALDMVQVLRKIAQSHATTGFTVSKVPDPEKGDWAALERIAFPLIRLRGATVGKGCGWPLNLEIVKHPFDGAEHVTTCPNCGNMISWKAPVFD